MHNPIVIYVLYLPKILSVGVIVGHIIIGVVFIIGGLTGVLALKGTGSSGALAVVGVVLVMWGIIQGDSSDENSKGDKKKSSRKGKQKINKPRKSMGESETNETPKNKDSLPNRIDRQKSKRVK